MVVMDNSATLLGLLDAGVGYGYDLKNTYDKWFGSRKPLAFGQVYAVLARLSRDGLIAPVGEEAGSGPERKKYEITQTGRQQVTAWLFTADPPHPSLQSNLFAKTVIALLLHADAGHLLDLQRVHHRARMRQLTQEKRDAPLTTILLCDYALFHIEADLRWIDLTEARLTQLREEIVK
jgi:DNA-binding PadR family transcriptional regulator